MAAVPDATFPRTIAVNFEDQPPRFRRSCAYGLYTCRKIPTTTCAAGTNCESQLSFPLFEPLY